MPNVQNLNIDLQTQADQLIDLSLEEDIGRGDVTCNSVIPEASVLSGAVVFREVGVLSGSWIAERVFKRVDESIAVTPLKVDGDEVGKGEKILKVSGPARGILTAERTALNFLQRLSGIATLTREYVLRVARTSCQILDTRKTTPGWRRLEKYAVRCGGGANHRMGLYDRIMVKDNHLALRNDLLGIDDWTSLVLEARKTYPDIPVEIEVDRTDQYARALSASPDWILLDNMSLEDITDCVKSRTGCTKLEASGGVNLDTVAAIAETGVDAISVGALTHSSLAIDIGLDFGPFA